VQTLAATTADPRVLIGLGIAASLGFAYLIWRKRNKEVQATTFSLRSVLLAFVALFLFVMGFSLLVRRSSQGQVPPPINISQWIGSAGNYTSTASGSYSAFALLAVATLGILVFAGVGVAWRVASKTQRAGVEPPPGKIAPSREPPVPEFGPGPRGTVLRCYWVISETLQRRGHLEASRLTAREFESLAGAELKSTRGFLHEATTLFEKAKYSDYPITQQEAERSVVCLKNLAPVGGEGEGPTAVGDVA
jgi:hypothetical protein